MESKIAFTINEAAEYSGIGRSSLRQLINWKKISIIRIGIKIIIRVATLNKFLELNEGKTLK